MKNANYPDNSDEDNAVVEGGASSSAAVPSGVTHEPVPEPEAEPEPEPELEDAANNSQSELEKGESSEVNKKSALDDQEMVDCDDLLPIMDLNNLATPSRRLSEDIAVESLLTQTPDPLVVDDAHTHTRPLQIIVDRNVDVVTVDETFVNNQVVPKLDPIQVERLIQEKAMIDLRTQVEIKKQGEGGGECSDKEDIILFLMKGSTGNDFTLSGSLVACYDRWGTEDGQPIYLQVVDGPILKITVP